MVQNGSPSRERAGAGVLPRRLSDTDILQREFFTRDPDSLPGIVQKLPHDFEDAVIEFAFDVTPPESERRTARRIWCAKDQRRTHWKGFVMVSPTKQRFVVGRVCGKKLFGLDFNVAVRDFLQLRRRQVNLITLRQLKGVLPAAIEELRRLQSSSGASQFDAVRNQLRDRMPRLSEAIKEVITKRGGELVVEERVRDGEAEARRKESRRRALKRLLEQQQRGDLTTTEFKRQRDRINVQARKEEESEIYRISTETLGMVAGGSLFRWYDETPLRTLTRQIEKMISVRVELLSRESETLSDKKIAASLSTLRACLDPIDGAMARLRAPAAFFAPGNLFAIAGWASRVSESGGIYRASGNMLIYEAQHGDKHVSHRWQELPAMPKFMGLKALLAPAKEIVAGIEVA